MWIELHQSLRNHPKIFRLMEALPCDQLQAIGIVSSLWLWALDAAPHGDISAVPDRALRVAIGGKWSGEKIRNSLVFAGFCDGDGQIHDWLEYGIRMAEQKSDKKEKTRERVRRYRARKNKGCDEDVTRYGNAAVTPCNISGNAPVTPLPDRTGPDITEPTQRSTPSSAARTKFADDLYRLYPRRAKPRTAKVAIEKALARLRTTEYHDVPSDELTSAGVDLEVWLFERVRLFANSLAGNNGTFTPHPSTWFNASSYLEDPAEWQRSTDNGGGKTRTGNGANQLGGNNRPTQSLIPPEGRWIKGGPGARSDEGE